MSEATKVVIDGKNAVLGRLASSVAKRLLNGQEIVIINSEKIIITGNPKVHQQIYWERRSRGSPQHGPFFPNSPDDIFRRTVRGMLPYRKARGRDALRRLHVLIGDAGLKGESAAKPVKANYSTLGDVGKEIGWKG